MDLLEPLNVINKRLNDIYGKSIYNEQIFRVVYSEDQLENRFGTYDDFVPGTKIYLRTVTEWRLVPKYKQWIHNKYLLERLVIVPEQQQNELATKLSYEPIYVFEDKEGNPLPPKWEAIEFIIDSLYAALGKKSMRKYVDPDPNREKSVAQIEQALFGDETAITDALRNKTAVIVPGRKE